MHWMSRNKVRFNMSGLSLRFRLFFLITLCLELKLIGQEVVPPSGVINPFISPDTTKAAITYNNLNSKTKAERDGLADAIIKASRVHTIPPNDYPVFNCNNWTNMQIMNSYDWGDGIYASYDTDILLFNGYKGFVLFEIYANGGTFADQGKDGLPLYGVTFRIPLYNAAHAMVTLLTGDNALNGNDWNDLEPRDGVTNVQPGEINIPLNTDEFTVYYPCIFKNSMHEKNFYYFRFLEFKIVNGEKILTYNINNDPYSNYRMRLITQRESDPPVINIQQGTDLDSLVCNINDANLKSAWYTIDGGAKIPLMTEVLAPVTEKKVAIKMNLPAGTHQIKVEADDYFRLTSQQTTQREIVNNEPPVITITSIIEGTVYSGDVQLIYNITDSDFASAWYSLDNGVTRITLGQSGTIQLQLSDGKYTLLIEAKNNKPQTATKSVSFEINRPSIITITSPVSGQIYDHDIQFVYSITDTDFASAWYTLNGGAKMTVMQSSTISLSLANGMYKIVVEATDQKPQTAKDSVSFEIKKSTGIEETELTEVIKIYPNPVKDQLNIEYKFDTPQLIYKELYDLDGILLFNGKTEILREGIDRIDMSGYSSGVYILRIRNRGNTYPIIIIKK
jgi:hypothetical protein